MRCQDQTIDVGVRIQEKLIFKKEINGGLKFFFFKYYLSLLIFVTNYVLDLD